MGDTSIQWTDKTWNPTRGCARVSSGCGGSDGGGCYAERQAHRFSGPGQPYEGLARLTKGGPRWTGKVRLVSEILTQPLSWQKPKRVFVNSMSDLFHESIPDEFIVKVFAVIALASRHQFQVLTKRPARMQALLSQLARSVQPLEKAARKMGYTFQFNDLSFLPWPIPNVWLGVSVENQETANERIPLLLKTPAAVRFLSCEPLLGPLDLTHLTNGPDEGTGWTYRHWNALTGDNWCDCEDSIQPMGTGPIDWCIIGGESGPEARPMQLAWASSLVEQCKAGNVACFVKQLGGIRDKRHDIALFPPELQVREFPQPPLHHGGQKREQAGEGQGALWT